MSEKAYKYRIYPNKKQQELIQKTFGCCRFVYNYFLDKRKSEYEKDKTSLSYNDTSKLLTKLKQERARQRFSTENAKRFRYGLPKVFQRVCWLSKVQE